MDLNYESHFTYNYSRKEGLKINLFNKVTPDALKIISNLSVPDQIIFK